MNREHWLTQVAKQVEPLYQTYGIAARPYRLTCGWPCRYALGRKMRRVGECHGLEGSMGKVHEIFISPVLDCPMEVAGTVCHELAHVAAGIDAGHDGMFRRVCKYVGLTKGKPTSVMPGKDLAKRLEGVVAALGPYPHQKLDPVGKKVLTEPKDLTLACPECECKVRISYKWLDRAGPPACGCGAKMLPVVKEEPT